MKSKTVNGRRPALTSLVRAALALAVAPAVFGPLGVAGGMVAAWRESGGGGLLASQAAPWQL